MSALFRTDMLSSQHRGRASISTLYLEQICEVASTRSKTLEDGLEIIIAFADNRGICFHHDLLSAWYHPLPIFLHLYLKDCSGTCAVPRKLCGYLRRHYTRLHPLSTRNSLARHCVGEQEVLQKELLASL